jgi:flagella basal body P-ring formation protein FlgA
MRVAFLIISILLFAGEASSGGLVARRTIPAGEALSAENAEDTGGALPPEDWIGKEVRRTLYAGQIIDPTGLRSPRLVFRNRTAEVRFVAEGLEMSMTGRVMQDGGAGDIVEIMNLESKKLIQGIVTEEGWILAQ